MNQNESEEKQNRPVPFVPLTNLKFYYNISVYCKIRPRLRELAARAKDSSIENSELAEI